MRHWLRSYGLLMKWSLLRMRTELPMFLAVQTIIAVGIVLGFSLLIPNLDPVSALYFTTGAMTVSLITIGMVIAPQEVSYRKQRGVLDYQRSMPVPRLAMVAADATIWVVVALPGLALTLAVAAMHFQLDLSVSPWVVPAILLVSAAAAGIGYCIAYAVKPVLVGLITNLIIIVALMFAPVNYPAERLPDWAVAVHQWLPFQYMAQAVRETIDITPAGLPVVPFLVLGAWTVVGLAVTSRVIARRI